MKPISLKMRAFGPYVGETTVDFRPLHEKGLFLIHGPTGGGKTTLIDAICFALYGQSSGGERTGRDFRSQFAGPRDETDVVFDFSIGVEHYRVERSPQYQRAKQHGEGTTEAQAKAALYRLDDGEATLLRDRPRDVNEQVQAILGFSQDQFRQVVVLPQGQFREFLKASSTEREDLLKVLFGTERYERLQEMLKRRALEAKATLDDLAGQMKRVLARAGTETAEDLAAAVAQTEEGCAQAEAQTQEAKAALDKCSERLEVARETAAKLVERDEALKALANLEDQADAVRALRREAEAAQRAASLVDVEQAAAGMARDAERARKQADSARKVRDQKQADEVRAREALEAEQAPERVKERDAVGRRVRDLEELQQRVADLSQATSDLGQATQAEAQARTVWEGAEAALVEADRRIAELSQVMSRLEQTASGAEALSLKLNVAEKVVKDRRALAAAQEALAGVAKTLQTAEGAKTLAHERWQADQKVAEDTEREWSESQAALLARELRNGEPCPVCGSREHPAPAAPPPTLALTDREAVAEAREAANRSRSAHEAAASKVVEARGRLEREKEKVAALTEDLGDRARADEKTLQADCDLLRQQLAEAQNAGTELSAAQARRTELQARHPELHDAVATADRALQEAVAQLGTCRTLVAERERGVPENLRAPGALSQALQAAQGRARELNEALEGARQRAEESARELIAAETSLESAETAADAANDKALQAADALAQRLAQQGFADEAEYQAAKRSEEQQQELARRIEQHDSAMAAAKDRCHRALGAAEGLQPPDVPALEAELSELKAAWEGAFQQHTNLRKDLEILCGIQDEHAALASRFAAAEKEYGAIQPLADTASGSGEAGISFHRFVLSWLLSEVTAAANLRLRQMTGSRYMLQVAGERQDRRRAGGLDLQVFDSHTGQARNVSTLSGGESFLAALALALGLAQVVQQQAAGIPLDTIFIDEGFGNLDPESLQQAVTTLMALREGGRLVGIISHVPELRERLPGGIRVMSSAHGSELQVEG